MKLEKFTIEAMKNITKDLGSIEAIASIVTIFFGAAQGDITPRFGTR